MALTTFGRLLRAFERVSRQPAKRPDRAAAAAVSDLVVPLTYRELEVLALVAEGASDQQVADQLFVTRETVKKHFSHIFDKLGAGNRTQAAARARLLGLLREDREVVPPPAG